MVDAANFPDEKNIGSMYRQQLPQPDDGRIPKAFG